MAFALQKDKHYTYRDYLIWDALAPYLIYTDD